MSAAYNVYCEVRLRVGEVHARWMHDRARKDGGNCASTSFTSELESLPARLPQSVIALCHATCRLHTVLTQHVETGFNSTHYSTDPSLIQQPPMRLVQFKIHRCRYNCEWPVMNWQVHTQTDYPQISQPVYPMKQVQL